MNKGIRNPERSAHFDMEGDTLSYYIGRFMSANELINCMMTIFESLEGPDQVDAYTTIAALAKAKESEFACELLRAEYFGDKHEREYENACEEVECKSINFNFNDGNYAFKIDKDITQQEILICLEHLYRKLSLKTMEQAFSIMLVLKDSLEFQLLPKDERERLNKENREHLKSLEEIAAKKRAFTEVPLCIDHSDYDYNEE